MDAIACPHCGHKQDAGTACLRCEIIFERYWDWQQRSKSRKRRAQSAAFVHGPRKQSIWLRILRHTGAAAGVVMLGVALWPSPPSYVVKSAIAEGKSREKIERYLSTVSQGRAASLELTQNELNAWVGERLSEAGLQAKGLTIDAENAVASYRNIRHVGIELEEGLVKTHLRLDLYSLPLTLELKGRLTSDAGTILLEPSHGRIGRLPLWAGAMKIMLRGLLHSAGDMKLVQMPRKANHVRVRKGRIVIYSI